MRSSKRGFTLIELLVVIAIIAILSVVVILTLNPAELLRQSRDANRISDLSTINEAINLYSTDQSVATNFSLGTASTTAISIFDPTATSTAGDQCQGLGLFSLGSTTWDCAPSSTYRSTNNTGWIPIAFSSISSGAPFGNLPVDPTNTTSSGDYYAYIPGTPATTWELVARLESQKYGAATGAGGLDGGYNSQYIEAGKDLTLALTPGNILDRVTSTDYAGLDNNGLVAYFPMDDGTGATVANDVSGNGFSTPWSGSKCSGTYYAAGKVGASSGCIAGINYFILSNSSSTLQPQYLSVFAWLNMSSYGPFNRPVTNFVGGALNEGAFAMSLNGTSTSNISCVLNTSLLTTKSTNSPNNSFNTPGVWYHVGCTYDGTTLSEYLNGVLVATTSAPGTVYYGYGWPWIIGGGYVSSTNGTQNVFNGNIDDVRIYNRALSSAEVQAIYNAEK